MKKKGDRKIIVYMFETKEENKKGGKKKKEKKKRRETKAKKTMQQQQVPNDEQLRSYVNIYDEKVAAATQLRKEIRQLKQALNPLLRAQPNGTLERGNGKIKVTDVKTSQPLNRQHLESSLISLLTSNQQMTAEHATQFSRAAVLYIWKSRPQKITTRIVRTFSKRKKTEDIVLGMEDKLADDNDM